MRDVCDVFCMVDSLGAGYGAAMPSTASIENFPAPATHEAPHNAKIFVKAIQTVDVIRTFHRPVTMPDKCSAERVQSHQRGRCERNRKLHEERNGGSQYRNWNAKLHHFYVEQLSFLDICLDEAGDECRVPLGELREGVRLQI